LGSPTRRRRFRRWGAPRQPERLRSSEPELRRSTAGLRRSEGPCRPGHSEFQVSRPRRFRAFSNFAVIREKPSSSRPPSCQRQVYQRRRIGRVVIGRALRLRDGVARSAQKGGGRLSLAISVPRVLSRTARFRLRPRAVRIIVEQRGTQPVDPLNTPPAIARRRARSLCRALARRFIYNSPHKLAACRFMAAISCVSCVIYPRKSGW